MQVAEDGVQVGRLRMAQYAGLSVPSTFMAAAYDLNDDTSPYGPVHFRDKQDVGLRLSRLSLYHVYEKGVAPVLPGPTARAVTSYMDKSDKLHVSLTFDGTGRA